MKTLRSAIPDSFSLQERDCRWKQARDIIATHALIGQVLGFVVAKRAYLRRSGLEMISDNGVSLILHQVTRLSCRAPRLNAD